MDRPDLVTIPDELLEHVCGGIIDDIDPTPRSRAVLWDDPDPQVILDDGSPF